MNTLRTPLLRYLLIMSIGCALILSAEYLGVFLGMDSYCYDLFFRLRGMEEPDRRILIAAIDEQTLSRLGRWPLKRTHYVKLLDALGAARVVGLDVLMAEPSDDDHDLIEAIRRHGRVVLPLSIEHDIPAWQTRSAPFRAGHIHLEQDIDGVVRRVYHTLYRNGHAYPSFDTALLELISGKPFPHTESAACIPGQAGRSDILQFDSRRINFYGAPGTFPHISMVDIIEGRYPPAFFTNRIILAGVTADGLERGFLTPYSQLRSGMSGVEIHANILNNLISRDHLVEAPESVRTLVSLFFALAGFLLFLRISGRQLLLGWTGGMAVALCTSYAAITFFQIWFSPILFYALLSFMFVFAYVVKLEQGSKKLREAEQEWEDSFNTINDGIVLVDGNGTITRMNEAARTMQAPRLLSLLVSSGFPASDGQKNAVQAIMEGIHDPLTGNSLEVKSHFRPGNSNLKGGAVHVIRDITAATKTEQEKEHLRFQLLQSQKMESIGRLAGGIAHDFNNILTAIIGYSEMALARAGCGEFLTECLTVINDSGQKAAALIRQLLVFSRKNSVELQVLNIGAIVENMAKMLRRVIGEDITLTLQTHMPVNPVLADPVHIEQVVMNLVVNARDAMPQGGSLDIQVADVELGDSFVSMHLDVAPGQYVLLAVSDTGLGMSPEVQSRVFEPFYTTKLKGEGTGLGLSTVYGIVKQLSGHIVVESEEGRGTVFKLYFPICSAQVGDTAEYVTEPPCEGNETILIAEDDTSILRMITSTLQPLGYNVLGANSGTDALQCAEQGGRPVDLLLTDVVMPGMGGRELADIVLKKYPDARVLFMSGYTDETLSLQGVEQQRSILIQKPLSPKMLARKVRDALDKACCASG
ncbi:MAG: CHASE2 domain-containing protein [Desulfuromonadales bacterium]|nr:CHASE2 domain-containing protein [Desulfuromonadales bacterium]